MLIDSSSDTTTPLSLPVGFNASAGTFNPTNNHVYVFGSDANGSAIHVLDGSTGQILLSKTSGFDPYIRGLTIDPVSNKLYAGSPTVFQAGTLIQAFDATTLQSTGTFNIGAAEMEFDAIPGRLFLLDHDYSSAYPRLRNSVGVLNPSTGVLSKTTVGYRPYEAVINAQTDRIYVADEQAAEMVVLHGTDHTVIARVPVNPVSLVQHYLTESELRNVAVSEQLNRVYLTRYPQVSDDGNRTAFIDVFDGTSNQLMQSIPLSSGSAAAVRGLAVDDSRHHIYAIGQMPDGAGSSPVIFVVDTNTNALTTTLPMMEGGSYIVVNPTTGRIYAADGGGGGGGHVQIYDGNDLSSRGRVSVGAVPGPMAVNKVTNKIYVANIGAGSVDNSVTVINGASDSVETTFSNTTQNNGDAVSAVAVSEATNKIYIADNTNGTEATGRIAIFNGTNNSFAEQIDVGRYPTLLAFHAPNQQLFVTNNEDGTLSVLGSNTPPPPPPPLHGGLSATVFRINGSSSPGNNVADTALHFSAQQSGTPEGMIVRVQYNSTPDNNATDWLDLANGKHWLHDARSRDATVCPQLHQLSFG